MSAYTHLTAPVVLSVTANLNWNDLDVSAYVSNASGVMLYVENLSGGSTATCQFRKNGSTDTYNGNRSIASNSAIYTHIGIDASNIFEYRLSSAGNWRISLIGYFNADDVVFFTNSHLIDSSNTGSWLTRDFSTEIGADTALAGLFLFTCDASTSSAGVRMPGSADTKTLDSVAGRNLGIAFAGMVNNSVEYIYNNSSLKLWFVGYIKVNITPNINMAQSAAPTPATWEQLTNVGSNFVGAYVYFESGTTQIIGVRPNGSAAYEDRRGRQQRYRTLLFAGTDNDGIDGYRASSGDFYTMGILDKVDIAAPKANAMFFGQDF